MRPWGEAVYSGRDLLSEKTSSGRRRSNAIVVLKAANGWLEKKQIPLGSGNRREKARRGGLC